MKDLGYLRYFLDIEVAYSPRGYILSQSNYANDIISHVGLTNERQVDTQVEINHKLTSDDGELFTDPTRYRELIGSPVYLTITRPNITYAVHIVSQFASAPRTSHWFTILSILRYLQGTLYHGLLLSSTSNLTLRALSNADWAGDPSDRKSTIDYCIFLGKSLLSWKRKKQSAITRSSAQSMYRTMAFTTVEIIWFRGLFDELGILPSSATPMYIDNQSAIQIAKNLVFHERTKHIEINCHFVRHYFLAGSILLPHTSSTTQLADFFTKSHTVV